MVVVYTLRVREDWVRFPAARQIKNCRLWQFLISSGNRTRERGRENGSFPVVDAGCRGQPLKPIGFKEARYLSGRGF